MKQHRGRRTAGAHSIHLIESVWGWWFFKWNSLYDIVYRSPGTPNRTGHSIYSSLTGFGGDAIKMILWLSSFAASNATVANQPFVVPNGFFHLCLYGVYTIHPSYLWKKSKWKLYNSNNNKQFLWIMHHTMRGFNPLHSSWIFFII